jgi:hypothetical protein
MSDMISYDVGQRLGKDGRDTTYFLVSHKSKSSVRLVMKCVSCANKGEGHVILKEAKIQQILPHQHIVKYNDVFLS